MTLVMQGPARELVFGTLFNLLASLQPVPFKTVTRRMMMPDEALQVRRQLPMLILWEQNQHTRYDAEAGVLAVTEYMADLIIYFINPQKDENNPASTFLTPGSTILNPLMDQVYATLAPDDLSSGRLTLKIAGTPTVAWCRIEGEAFVETGDTDPNGLGGSQIPISILVGG